RAYPGVRIQFIKTNEGRKVETMISGGDAPDIINVGMDRLHYFVQAGVLRDLGPFMASPDLADLRSFFPATMAPFRQGEHVYAIPWGYVPFILFYNKNLFDKYGVPYPDDRWTWEDYRRAAIRLTHDLDGDGIVDEFGASFAQWQDGYYCWIYQNGGRVLGPHPRTQPAAGYPPSPRVERGSRSSDGGEGWATFDDPDVVQAVAFLHRLTRVDRVMPTEANQPKQAGMGLFEAGRLAM